MFWVREQLVSWNYQSSPIVLTKILPWQIHQLVRLYRIASVLMRTCSHRPEKVSIWKFPFTHVWRFRVGDHWQPGGVELSLTLRWCMSACLVQMVVTRCYQQPAERSSQVCQTFCNLHTSNDDQCFCIVRSAIVWMALFTFIAVHKKWYVRVLCTIVSNYGVNASELAAVR